MKAHLWKNPLPVEVTGFKYKNSMINTDSLPTVLITGASSGIGRELAYIFAANGHGVVLAARSLGVLEEIAADISSRYNVAAVAVQADLSRHDGSSALYNEVVGRGIHIDILVNNAGFGTGGPFSVTPLEKHLDLLQVNIAALTELTWHFLPAMLERGSGRVLNVASTAAFQPGPFLAVYYASKAYVLSFSEAIAEELRGSGITVTALCPGPTHTRFSAVAELNRSRLFNTPLTMRAEDVAQLGYNAVMKGKRVAIPGLVNRVVAFSTRLIPRVVATRVAGRLQSGKA